MNEHDFTPLKAEGSPKEPRVHLLYRPGHYDVLYFRGAGIGPSAAIQNGLAQSPQHLQQQPLSPGIIASDAAIAARSPAHPGYEEPDSSSAFDAIAAPASPYGANLNPVSPLVQQPLSPRSPAQSEELNSTQPDL